MADTTTPNLGLTLPETFPGDVWGAKLNTNFTTLDTEIGNLEQNAISVLDYMTAELRAKVVDRTATSDDAAAITSAVDQAFTAGGSTGRTVLVNAGLYLLSSTVTWAVSQGFGVRCEPGAVFKATSSMPADSRMFLPSASSAGQRFFWFGGQLDGRDMPARVSGAPDLLTVAGANFQGVHIEGVHFLCNDTRAGTAGDSCLFLAEGEDYFVSRCIFQGAVDAGVYISGDSSGTSGQRIVVTENVFLECGDVGCVSKRFFQDHIVSNNFVKNCTVGIAIGSEVASGATGDGLLPARKATITGNYLTNVGRGIEARWSDGTTITANRIETFGFNEAGTAVADAAILVSGSDYCVVTGNVIIATGAPDAGLAGIRVSERTVDGTTRQSDYTLIDNNTILDVPRGIREENSCDNTFVGGGNHIIGATVPLEFVGANSHIGANSFGANAFVVKTGSATHFAVQPLSGAINYPRVIPSTSTTVQYSAEGSSTDVNLAILGKGAGALLMGGVANSEALRIGKGVSGGNALEVQGVASGGPPRFVARGADTNIDLFLVPKGTGLVRYGTHSAIGAETVTGFIEIKDAGGTTRKLAVVS